MCLEQKNYLLYVTAHFNDSLNRILHFQKTESMVKGEGEAEFTRKPKKLVVLIWEIEFTFNNRIHLWVNMIDSRIVSVAFATTRLALFIYWNSLRHVDM